MALMRLQWLFLSLVLIWLLGASILYSSNLYRTYYTGAMLLVPSTLGIVPRSYESVYSDQGQPEPPASRNPSRVPGHAVPGDRSRLWQMPPPLCGWRPSACAHLNRTARAMRRWQRQWVSNRNDAEWVCRGDHGSRPVRLELRGKQFRSWWGHVMPQIATSASQLCPVPCRVRNAPFPEADLVVDTLAPGAALPHPDRQKLAVVALEHGGGRGGTHSLANLMRTDFLVSWLRNSQVPINYMYAWQNLCQHLDGDLERCMAPVPTVDQVSQKRLAAAFVSNCRASERLAFMRELARHMPVDSWGRCLHSPGLPAEAKALDSPSARDGPSQARPAEGSGADARRGMRKIALLSGYKFALAFENSVRQDYLTEKALHPLLAATVPVLWGAPQADAFMPGGPGSYINALDFPSPQALARHLLALDRDPERYLRHFDWRTSRGGTGATGAFQRLQRQNFVALGPDSWPCRLCQAYRRTACAASSEHAGVGL